MFEHQTATEASLARGNDEPSFTSRVRDMARQARIEADGNDNRALDLLKQRIERDGALRDFMVDEACRDYLRSAVVATRATIERQAWAVPAQAGERMAGALRNRESAYDWPLPIEGGKTLRNATRADIKASAAYHRGQAGGHVRRAEMYEAIDRRMARAKAETVRGCFSEDQIEKLLSESGND